MKTFYTTVACFLPLTLTWHFNTCSLPSPQQFGEIDHKDGLKVQTLHWKLWLETLKVSSELVYVYYRLKHESTTLCWCCTGSLHWHSGMRCTSGSLKVTATHEEGNLQIESPKRVNQKQDPLATWNQAFLHSSAVSDEGFQEENITSGKAGCS